MSTDEFTRFDPSGVGWRLVPEGVSVEGSGVERTPGPPRTTARVLTSFEAELQHAAAESGVPLLLLVATVATESGGRADFVRLDPGFRDEASTPAKCRVGLMQTSLSTARELLQMSVGLEALKDPLLSLRAGAMAIATQVNLTRLDPVLVAAAYNAGTLALQTGPKNRWKLRQYPLGTSQHVDRFIRFYNDAIAAAAQAAGAAPRASTSSERHSSMASSSTGPEVRFARPESGAFVPSYAISVVQELLRASGNVQAVVTSTLRNAGEQARVMFQNCEKHGAANQMELYGRSGQAVVTEYIKAKQEGLSPTETIARMRDEILRLGPYKVSHHAGDPTKLAVLDIDPGSLGDAARFIRAARADRRVAKTLVPPKDPAIHLEIPLTRGG